jgi:D-aminoacyl-tRNA deacylase
MKAVVQRVRSAAVSVGEGASEREVGRIGRGLIAFVGVERADQAADVDYIAGKIREIRVFEDPQDPSRHLNRSVQDVGGEVLVVSQFTILGDCRKGRRPSFDAAAPPPVAKPLYEAVVGALRHAGLTVATGVFQASMQIEVVNDGPVTLLLESRRSS